MRMMKWAWVAVVAWAAAAGAWAQPYMVPVGTNTGWSGWWVTKPGTNELDNWEGWYTQNTNWVWMSNQWVLVRGDLTTVSNSLQSHIAEGGGGITMEDVRNQKMVTNNNAGPVTFLGNVSVGLGAALYGNGVGVTNVQTATDALNSTIIPSDTSGLIVISAGSNGAQPLSVNTTNLTWDGFSVTAWGFNTKGGSSYGEGATLKGRSIAPVPVAGKAQVYSLTNNGVAEAYVQNDGGVGGIIATKDFVSASTNALWSSTTNHVKAATTSVYSAVMNNLPANAIYTAGIVSAPGAVAHKTYKTDGSGNPAWLDEVRFAEKTNSVVYDNILFAKSSANNFWWITNDTAKEQLRFIGEALEANPLSIDWGTGTAYGIHSPNVYGGNVYAGVTNAAYIRTDANGKIMATTAPASSRWEFSVTRTTTGASGTPIYTNLWSAGTTKLIKYRLMAKSEVVSANTNVIFWECGNVMADQLNGPQLDANSEFTGGWDTSGGLVADPCVVTTNNAGVVWTVFGAVGTNMVWKLVGDTSDTW